LTGELKGNTFFFERNIKVVNSMFLNMR